MVARHCRKFGNLQRALTCALGAGHSRTRTRFDICSAVVGRTIVSYEHRWRTFWADSALWKSSMLDAWYDGTLPTRMIGPALEAHRLSACWRDVDVRRFIGWVPVRRRAAGLRDDEVAVMKQDQNTF